MRSGNLARFPASYAPFLGVANADVDVSSGLEQMVFAEETVYLLGVAPRIPPSWSLRIDQPLAQMVCTSPIPLVDGPDIIELTQAHRDDVLTLTALVYPHFFRARTMELGRYFGIYESGRLAAMIGERLGSASAQELSAICTHPDFTGRGYAKRLLAMLSNDNLQRGRTPFLHVGKHNTRAVTLYLKAGYEQRRDIEFWALTRLPMQEA